MSNDTTPEYVFAHCDDGDDWHEEIADAIEEMRADDEDCRTLYMGEVRHFTHSDFIAHYHIQDIVTKMQDWACEEADENSVDYQEGIPYEKLADLRSVIVDWFNATVPQPQFCTVDNIVEIEVQLDAEGEYVSHCPCGSHRVVSPSSSK